MKGRELLGLALLVLAVVFVSYQFALAGEPQSAWLWHRLGVL